MKNNNKNEKKGGVFGLLNGGASNAGGITPGVIGGTAQAASSASGLAALFTGKALGTVLTVALVAGIGAFGLMSGSNMGNDMPNSATMMASAQEAQNYVPAIERANAENAGKSSIGMFNDTNRGAVKFDVDPTLNVKGSASEAEDSGFAEMSEYDTDTGAAESGDAADMAEVAEESGATLNASGFGNIGNTSADTSARTLNTGSTGKLVPTAKFMPKKFKSVKEGQALAFKGAKRAQKRSAATVGARRGKKAFGQAKFMNNMMKSAAASSNYATSRATMDAAWEGTASGGDASNTLDAGALTEGEGMSFGATGSSLSGSNNSTFSTDGSSYVPEVSEAVDDTPWQKDLQTLQKCLMAGLAMLGVAALLVELANKVSWPPLVAALRIAAAVMIAAALALAAVAVAKSIALMTKYQQKKLGGIWLLISGVTFAGIAIVAFTAGKAALTAKANALAALAESISSMKMWILGGCLVGGLAMGLASSVQGEKSQSTGTTETAMVYQLPDNPAGRSLLS